jgi:SPP1 family phage portal protein
MLLGENMAVTTEDLDKILGILSGRANTIKVNEAYGQGYDPYILQKQQNKPPDNRIPTGLGKVSIDSMTGYAGRAGDKTVNYDIVATETKDDNDPFIEYARQMDSYNEANIENSELYEQANTQGESYEIFWVSDELGLKGGLLTTEFKIVPNEEVFLKYDNNIKKKLLYAVHFTGAENSGVFNPATEATVYYPLYHEKWSRAEDGGAWVKEKLDKPEYPFRTVPVNIFKSNRRSLPLFEAGKPLIDAYDIIMSKSLNEIDRFNELIMLIGELVTPEVRAKLTSGQISVIDRIGQGGGDKPVIPSYLQKDLSGAEGFYNKFADRIMADFLKLVSVLDLTDDALAGNQSGIALQLRLVVMEFKASQIDTYFDKGLIARMGYYGDVFNASTKVIDIGEYKALVDSKRNIPVDLKAHAEIAQMLMGIISKETLLRVLPASIVKDVEKELKLLAEEAPTGTLGFDEDGEPPKVTE